MRCHELGKPLELVTQRGLLRDDVKQANQIGKRLATLSAMDAQASVKADQLKIQYRIMDSVCRRGLGYPAFKYLAEGGKVRHAVSTLALSELDPDVQLFRFKSPCRTDF